jgi:hypothetical protein
VKKSKGRARARDGRLFRKTKASRPCFHDERGCVGLQSNDSFGFITPITSRQHPPKMLDLSHVSKLPLRVTEVLFHRLQCVLRLSKGDPCYLNIGVRKGQDANTSTSASDANYRTSQGYTSKYRTCPEGCSNLKRASHAPSRHGTLDWSSIPRLASQLHTTQCPS